MRQKIERGLLCLGLVWLLAACGGGGGASTPPPVVVVPPPTVGASGGTVTEASGASVIVPAGALVADTTIRVAMDSTGAPVVPAGLVSAGNTYVITPHGGFFAQPVEVRIPAPNVTLLPTQELKLAKAEQGGQWVVLVDSVLTDGVLSAKVNGFSYFMPVIVTYALPILQAVPWKAVTSHDCGDQSCDSPLGVVTHTITWTTNGGQLPGSCTAANSQINVNEQGIRPSPDFQVLFPVNGGGSVSRTVSPAFPLYHQFNLMLLCEGHLYVNMQQYIVWGQAPYPAVEVLRFPAQFDVVEGLNSRLEALMRGGASKWVTLNYSIPTATNRAVIDWQRSDDDGASWRPIARSYQDEANPSPLGAGFDWMYWSVSHGFIAAAADQGALIRIYACYTPPDVAPPPCVTGPSTRLNVLRQSALPAIIDSPRSLLIRTGQTASLSATASGAPAPTLQWQTLAANSTGAWADVSSGTGATTGNYTTSVLALTDNGVQYRVVASNALGSAQSAPVTVSVGDLDVAPTLTTQPADLGVTVGNDAVFAVAAHGTEAMSYLWRFNGAPITGANSPVLRLAAVSAGQAGSYSVDVSNSAGAVSSNAATLVVTAGAPAMALPNIVTQPAALVVSSGNSATFAVGSNASGFQWRKDGVNIASATSAALTLSNVSASDVGVYSVVVSNSVGSVTSGNASLSLSTPPGPVITVPTITTQPATLVVLPGAATTLAVAASGTGPLTYQWSLNGAPISGAIGAVLYLPSVTSLDAGNYTVSVGNSAGSTGSNAAQLILVGAPSITAQPVSASAFVGATATFSVTSSGNSPLYQWTRNNVAILGANLASYTTPTLGLSDNGAVYGVIVYNGAGLVFSQGAVLSVTPAPVAVGGSVSGLTGAGLQLQNNAGDTLAVSASGTFTFASGIATGTSYAVTVLTQPSGQTCTVQNGSGTANAAVTTVLVTCTSATPLALVTNSGSGNGVNGLSVYRINAATGTMSFLNNVSAGNTPYAVAVTPNGLFAYVSNQMGDSVSAFGIDNISGVLTPLATRASNNASGLAMDRLGRYLWVANYGWNTLSGFSIAANGALTPVVGSPLNSTYALPYVITAHPTMDFVYVAYQSSSHPVSVYSVEPTTGALTLLQTLTYVISSANAVVIDPIGRYLYVNDGSGICSFAINATSGLLSSKGCVSVSGSTFALAIHPTGNYVYVANTSNNTVTVYAVNLATGALTQVGTPADVGSNPRGVTVSAAGTTLYVSNYGSNDVSAFSIGGSGATLTSLGAAVPAGSAPQGIALTP